MMFEPDWYRWRKLFENRAGRPLPPLVADYDYRQLPKALARSLAIFQLGESGGGAVIEQAARSHLPGTGSNYERSLRLFVEEEHRHANILAMSVRLMGGDLIRSNWTARLFVVGRRLLGLRLKIMVLLAAEIVGLSCYSLIAKRLPPGSLRSWLTELVDDERDHLAFHSEFLRRQCSGPAERLAFLAAWRALMAVTVAVVLIDHARTFRELHIDVRTVVSACARYGRQAEAIVLSRDDARAGQGSAAGCGT